MKLNTYENKSGYRIRATEKAYRLFYEKQGFFPVEETEGEKSFAKMTTAELRAYLDGKGISYDAKAKKADLVILAEGKVEGNREAGEDDSGGAGGEE